MANPVFRDLSRAFETPEEGRELWSGVPADEEPAYAEEIFRKASDAALARENALPKEGYVPAGTGPMVEPSLDSTLAAMPSGLRSRKPLGFTPDMARLQGKLAGFLGGDRSLESPIPIKTAPATSDAAAPTSSTLAPVTPETPAGKPDSSGKNGMPAPSSEGAGGDALSRLSLGQALVRGLEGSGSIIAGRDLRSGAADTLGERMKQIEALRAKREEQSLVDEKERANNRAQVEYLMKRFPERAKDLEGLLSLTGKPNFSQMLRVEEQVALDKARKEDIGAKAEDRAKTQEYRAGVLGLRKDTLEEKKRYNAVQAGLKQAELDLRRAENERKAAGSNEPSAKERNTFQVMMKPAESTAVALKDAANLDTISEGMLSTGKPPPFLTRSAIAQFNLGDAARGELAKSNPEAFDLLTEMARLKTMVGHEYFGSALSPSEAERQRQFLDFGMLDSPESVATKMKNYRAALANKASVFLRPRVISHPLGAEWSKTSGLDVISAPGSTFAGLLDAPKGAEPKASAVPTAPAPAVKKTPSARSIEALKKNPDQMTRQQFDEAFGPGSAAKALGE